VAKWQQRDESGNFTQVHDEELAKEELRPLVFEDVRKQVCRRWACLPARAGGGGCVS
jgi:hypothetical protein